ncbi:MAG: hypothetical protein ACI8SK_001086 [Shewanella sp.]
MLVAAGILIPLYNGYPAVDGNDSFDELNRQVRAWLDIYSVSLTAIFVTKMLSTPLNQSLPSNIVTAKWRFNKQSEVSSIKAYCCERPKGLGG